MKELADEMDIIVYGEFPRAIRAVAKEYHRKVNVEKLPQTLCALDLELALFPAVGDGNDFASGSYMLLAVAATGCNVLCSDVKAYYIDAPVIRLKNKNPCGNTQFVKCWKTGHPIMQVVWRCARRCCPIHCLTPLPHSNG